MEWTRVLELDHCFRCELTEFYSHGAAYSQPGGGAYAIGLDEKGLVSNQSLNLSGWWGGSCNSIRRGIRRIRH